MSQTTSALLPILELLAGGPGSGIAAYYLFQWFRRLSPAPVVGSRLSTPERAFAAVLWTPQYARYTAIILAGLVSVACSALLALLQGQDVLLAVDTVVASLVSMISSQVWHGLQQLPSTTVERPFISRPVDSGAGQGPSTQLVDLTKEYPDGEEREDAQVGQ